MAKDWDSHFPVKRDEWENIQAELEGWKTLATRNGESDIAAVLLRQRDAALVEMTELRRVYALLKMCLDDTDKRFSHMWDAWKYGKTNDEIMQRIFEALKDWDRVRGQYKEVLDVEQ